MSNTTAYEVINVSGYEVCRGKTKDKRYFFHTTSTKRDSKSISFYADYESERERYIERMFVLIIVAQCTLIVHLLQKFCEH